ncbi:hypothetical protein XVE_1804 [Xanthomonas vesicatoria ATCC 35937]|uniref:Uncharacterized protein n=1 Tax=Xanthomonas vesicatoria ATCC 35937 TaxID=925775 RepID=F0BCH7_9XANT|nr:hypothetical protein XVE_1804 [Xanthomonas vesicatoria ATCC 35937]
MERIDRVWSRRDALLRKSSSLGAMVRAETVVIVATL